MQSPRRRLTYDSRFGDLREEATGNEEAYDQYELSEVPIQHGDGAVQWVQGYAW